MLGITLQCTSVVGRWYKHHLQEDIQKPGIRREPRYGCADIIIIREDGITFYGIQKAVLLAVEGHRHNHLVFLL